MPFPGIHKAAGLAAGGFGSGRDQLIGSIASMVVSLLIVRLIDVLSLLEKLPFTFQPSTLDQLARTVILVPAGTFPLVAPL